ncbi:MAG TPA: hypothetical protein VFG99_03420, partial [Chloroflexia bacterium]|nr:hypothetical protein [Chloroflexia bacterium]
MDSRAMHPSQYSSRRRTLFARSGAVLAWLVVVPFLFGSGSQAATQHPAPVGTAEPQATSVPATTLRDAFAAAAARWGVPAELLMAIGYVESHWEQRGGEPSIDGGYGVMHL